jgi:hypothetical protein
MEKEFQKNKLLNSIIYQFHELMDSKINLVTEGVHFGLNLAQLENGLIFEGTLINKG